MTPKACLCLGLWQRLKPCRVPAHAPEHRRPGRRGEPRPVSVLWAPSPRPILPGGLRVRGICVVLSGVSCPLSSSARLLSHMSQTTPVVPRRCVVSHQIPSLSSSGYPTLAISSAAFRTLSSQSPMPVRRWLVGRNCYEPGLSRFWGLNLPRFAAIWALT